MIFKALKHKTKPNTWGTGMIDPHTKEGLIEENDTPLLQPRTASMEEMRDGFEKARHSLGVVNIDELLTELEQYELVEVEIRLV